MDDWGSFPSSGVQTGFGAHPASY